MPSESMIIRYGTERHKTIVDAVMARYRMSKRAMEERYPEFRKSEEQFLAYIPETQKDAERRVEFYDRGNPTYRTVVVPMSYAMLMAAHTYWTSVFLGRSPVLQFEGRHGEAQNQTQAVEAIMNYQLGVGKWLPILYNWLFMPGQYGFGFIGSYWAREERVVSRIEEKPVTVAGFAISGRTKKVKTTETVVKYEGNRIYNISPYNAFPDTRVPLSRFQDGEFFGRIIDVNWNEIKRREYSGEYFNVDVLRRKGRARAEGDTEVEAEASTQRNLPDPSDHADTAEIPDIGMQNMLEMEVELIPREWKVGEGDRPEKWIFTVETKSEVLVGARPSGAYHDMFQKHLIEYEPGGMDLFRRSMLEHIRPLTDSVTWLLNSHMYNVRQTLNNQFIYDPSRITTRDMTNAKAGLLARVKPAGYGQDVRTMFSQIPVGDVTQGHIGDMQVFEQMLQRVTGINENLMGAVNAGSSRKTATEVRSSSTFGINRLKMHAEYFSATGFDELASVCLSNTQQYYSDEKQFRIAGDQITQEAPFAQVTPDSIAGSYDFVPVDGTLPVDRFAQANLWRQIFADMRQFPSVQNNYDMPRVFSYVAKLAGAKNFDQFRIKVAPDSQVQQGAERGNLVPVEEISDEQLQNPGANLRQISGTGTGGA